MSDIKTEKEKNGIKDVHYYILFAIIGGIMFYVFQYIFSKLNIDIEILVSVALISSSLIIVFLLFRYFQAEDKIDAICEKHPDILQCKDK